MYNLFGGYLLLCCKLGQPSRKVLKHEEFHKFLELDTDVRGAVGRAGCPKGLEALIADEMLMQRYARQIPGDIVPLILTDSRYPRIVKQRLKKQAPGILWAKGNLALLERPAIALVGSRNPEPRAVAFAKAVGALAAKRGYVLVSGNADGTDSIGQEACLAAGGCVISVVADTLLNKQTHDRILYLSEDDFDMKMTGERALSRNQVIHSFGSCTYVAQSTWGRGGTYSGTSRNLKNGWSPVIMHSDGSEAACQIQLRGGRLLELEELLAL